MLKKQIINSVASCCLITTMALTGCKSTEVEKVPTSSLAKEAFNDKNWEDAVKEYSLAIKEEGPKYEFFLNRGISYNNLKEHNAAITDFYNAHKLRPDDEGVSLYKAAEIFFKLKSYDKAVYLCKQIGQDNPNAIQLEIKSYQNLLIQAKQRKDFQKVKEISLALLKLQPHNYEFKLDILRAKVYSKQNKIDREDLEKEIIKLLKEKMPKNIYEQLVYIRTLNLYKIATPESLRKAYVEFNKFTKSKGKANLNDNDYFWSGLLAKVCLKDKESQVMWERLPQKFIKQNLDALKNIGRK